METAMSEKLRRLRKGTPDDWPSLALLEFTMALSKTMAANNMKQKDLAKALDVSPPYISSVMSGNENLTVEQMSRLAEAAGGSLHLTIAPQGLYVRWTEDTINEQTTEAELSSPFHSSEAASNIPAKSSMFEPLPEATSSYHGGGRLIPGPWSAVDQNVPRPRQSPSFPASSRSSKPMPSRLPSPMLLPK
jgi:transcriptional regulator with XRE-family HTH domain